MIVFKIILLSIFKSKVIMKRRDFFKKRAKGVVAASIIPIVGNSINTDERGEGRKVDNWYQVATREKGIPIRKKDLNADVLVAVGGVAGCRAAVSAARNEAKTILVQDRSVLGGECFQRN